MVVGDTKSVIRFWDLKELFGVGFGIATKDCSWFVLECVFPADFCGHSLTGECRWGWIISFIEAQYCSLFEVMHHGTKFNCLRNPKGKTPSRFFICKTTNWAPNFKLLICTTTTAVIWYYRKLEIFIWKWKTSYQAANKSQQIWEKATLFFHHFWNNWLLWLGCFVFESFVNVTSYGRKARIGSNNLEFEFVKLFNGQRAALIICRKAKRLMMMIVETIYLNTIKIRMK